MELTSIESNVCDRYSRGILSELSNPSRLFKNSDFFRCLYLPIKFLDDIINLVSCVNLCSA